MAGVCVSRLNNSAVKKWLAEGGEREFRDARYPEIRLRAVSKRAKASVFLVMNEQGHTNWEKLGQWPRLCVKTLIADLPALLVKRKLGKMVKGQCFSVADVLNWYVKRFACSSADNWQVNVRSVIKCQLVKRLGDVVLSELDYLTLDSKLVKPMLDDNYAASYVRDVVSKLKVVFAKAAELRLISQNPVTGYKIKSSIKVKPKDTQLFESDLEDLFTRLSECEMPVRMMFVLMMMYGTRIDETRQARWDHFAGDVWVIPASHTKNKKEHRIPLTNAAKLLVKFYKRWQLKHVGKRYCLFPGYRGAISLRTAQYWSEEIRFKHFTSHDLRILFRTVIADLGVDTVVGERLVNHSLPVLIRTYMKSTLDKGMSKAIEQYHSYLIDAGFSSVAPEILPRSSANNEQMKTPITSGWL